MAVILSSSDEKNIGQVGRIVSIKKFGGEPHYGLDVATHFYFRGDILSPATGADLIKAERQRQIEVEGFDMAHDYTEHHMDDLARAGAFYALPAHDRCRTQINKVWPFSWEWCKPTPDNRLKELAKAGALIAAEIDRIQNMERLKNEER